MNVSIGNEETRSDGHGERKDSVELAETVRSLQREVQSGRADNEKMFNQLNDRLMHNLTLMQRQMMTESDSGHRKGRQGHSRKEFPKEHKHSRNASKRRREHHFSSPSRKDSDSSEESISSLDRAPSKQKKRYRNDDLQGELRKIKPPNFNGESEKGEDAEAWSLGMRKYFRIHNYSSKMEANIAIHQLQVKASIWWEQLVRVKD